MSTDRDFLRAADDGERWVWLAGKMESVEGVQKDHETRMRALERWRWLVIGAVVVIGAAWQWVIDRLGGGRHA